jgi:hypothetical protein
MRVLLDECLPRKLKGHIRGHAVTTVPEMGWAGKKNGALLQLTAQRFDVFVTIDQGIRFQQNLAALLVGSTLRVVVLAAPSNRLETLLPLVPHLLQTLSDLRPGQVIRITPQGVEVPPLEAPTLEG